MHCAVDRRVSGRQRGHWKSNDRCEQSAQKGDGNSLAHCKQVALDGRPRLGVRRQHQAHHFEQARQAVEHLGGAELQAVQAKQERCHQQKGKSRRYKAAPGQLAEVLRVPGGDGLRVH